MNSKRILQMSAFFIAYSAHFFAGDDQRYNIGKNAILVAQTGSLTGVAIWAACAAQTPACCIGYSILAGTCGAATIASSAVTCKNCRQYHLRQNAQAHHVSPLQHNIPQAQIFMGIVPQAIQPLA